MLQIYVTLHHHPHPQLYNIAYQSYINHHTDGPKVEYNSDLKVENWEDDHNNYFSFVYLGNVKAILRLKSINMNNTIMIYNIENGHRYLLIN